MAGGGAGIAVRIGGDEPGILRDREGVGEGRRAGQRHPAAGHQKVAVLGAVEVLLAAAGVHDQHRAAD